MIENNNNIYPIFDRMLAREDKEELLKQRSVMIWFTGLSGSGKSTIAIALERELHKRGLLCRILDGDNIRSGINNNLGFTEADRIENIRRMLAREDKEELLKQRSVMIWFTGLSGSGKSTIAIALERELHKRGLLCRILDGDNIRSGINNNLGFTEADRIENIRRIAEVSKLFVDTGIVTIAAFISPSNDIREMAANIIGKDDFLEVYVSTPIEECERRDVKGLYAKARRGEIKNFTGISAPFEAPAHPALVLDTSALSLEESVNKLLELILPRIQKK